VRQREEKLYFYEKGSCAQPETIGRTDQKWKKINPKEATSSVHKKTKCRRGHHCQHKPTNTPEHGTGKQNQARTKTKRPGTSSQSRKRAYNKEEITHVKSNSLLDGEVRPDFEGKRTVLKEGGKP